MSVGLSIRAYARHRGVSHTAVRKALASGRIETLDDGSIDPAAADEQWASATNLSKPRNSVIGKPGGREARPHPRPAEPPARPSVQRSFESDRLHARSSDDDPAPLSGADTGASRLASSYAASRAARESYLARLAKLEFEERSGKLVDADEVRAQVFALGRRMRDSMLGLPDRLAPVLAGLADQAEVHRVLAEEISRALAELTSAPVLKQPEARREAS